MNYKNYYSLIRKLVNNKITRRRFVIEWKLLQEEEQRVSGSGR